MGRRVRKIKSNILIIVGILSLCAASYYATGAIIEFDITNLITMIGG